MSTYLDQIGPKRDLYFAMRIVTVCLNVHDGLGRKLRGIEVKHIRGTRMKTVRMDW